ncbi:MAG: GFA family protein [Pseudomonadales bacterium]
MKEYEGGCHCGSVRYRCANSPELTFYCHCRDCQRTTGSPFSMELMIAKEGFHLQGEMEAYVITGDSGKPVTRWFCSACGSGIYLEADSDPDSLFLKVGSLDDASWVQPEMHIYTAAKQPWTKIDDGLPQYEGMPD